MMPLMPKIIDLYQHAGTWKSAEDRQSDQFYYGLLAKIIGSGLMFMIVYLLIK
jgi:hypothetical protein